MLNVLHSPYFSGCLLVLSALQYNCLLYRILKLLIISFLFVKLFTGEGVCVEFFLSCITSSKNCFKCAQHLKIGVHSEVFLLFMY
jgi:hypothetical protein